MGGSTTSRPLDTAASQDVPASTTSVSTDASRKSESKCPVDHSKMSAEQLASWTHPWKSIGQHKATPEPKESEPPAQTQSKTVKKAEAAKPEKGCASGPVYDVYGQEISSANFMPATPNQLPSPGQRTRLSTARESSTIPKGGGAANGETWTYPSPQMFWNALARKGKADDVAEADMDTVVAVHNTMNERTWREVLDWEARYHCECSEPKLLRFRGRPDDLSPAARFRMAVWGYPKPFDRHDWVIDRCGKETARYIIDYYYREPKLSSDVDATEDPIEIHVRPAVDSVSAFCDRVRENVPMLAARAPGVDETKEMQAGQLTVVRNDNELDGKEFDTLTSLTPKAVREIQGRLQSDCVSAHEAAFKACSEGDSKQCNDAQVGVTYCAARHVCAATAKQFRADLENGADSQASYERMHACVQRFALMAHRVLQQSRGKPKLGPEIPTVPAPAVS